MKYSYTLQVPDHLSVNCYADLLSKQYNSTYTNSFLVKKPYKQSEKLLRTRSKVDLVVFYEGIDLETVKLQVQQSKNQLKTKAIDLLRRSTVELIQQTYEL